MKKLLYILSCCAVAGLLVCALPQVRQAEASNSDMDAATAEEKIREELIRKETKEIRDINPASTSEKVTSETADGPPYMTGDDEATLKKAADKAKEEIGAPPADTGAK